MYHSQGQAPHRGLRGRALGRQPDTWESRQWEGKGSQSLAVNSAGSWGASGERVRGKREARAESHTHSKTHAYRHLATQTQTQEDIKSTVPLRS